MKSLCITGHTQSSLNKLAEAFYAGGSSIAKNSRHNSEFSIHLWHENALERINQYSDSHSLSAGKLFDQIAIDIFLANHSSPLWHWTDTNSVQTLDYWHQFDPNILFVLVYSSPVEILTELFLNNTCTEKDFEIALSKWEVATKAMLAFRERNPERSVLIPRNCALEQTERCIETLNKKWQTNIQVKDLPKNNAVSLPPLPNLLINCYVDKKYSLRELDRLAKSLLDLIGNEHTTVEDKYLFEQLNKKTVSTRKTITTKKNDAPGLTKLEFSLINELEGENALLLAALHKTQEALELTQKASHQLSLELDQQKFKVKKLLKKAQTPWEIDSFNAKLIYNNNDKHIIEWELNETFVGDHYVDHIKFKTISEDHITGFSFEKNSNFLSTANQFDGVKEILLIPQKGSATAGSNGSLSKLSTTDWAQLKALAIKLIAFLNAPIKHEISNYAPIAMICKGLERLLEILHKWPDTLRYDGVVLNKSYQMENYHSIEIMLSNVVLGEKTWPSFTYRVATFSDENFDSHPRLEFPEDCGVLDSWFADNQDAEEKKFELRFAHPNRIDTTVWNRLSNSDHHFIAALISKLNEQVTSICPTDTQYATNGDWLALANSMTSIAKQALNPAKQRTKTPTLASN